MSERPETGDQHDGGTADWRGHQPSSESVTAEQPTSQSVTAASPESTEKPESAASSESAEQPPTEPAEAAPVTAGSATSGSPTAEQPSAGPAEQQPHHAAGPTTPAAAIAGTSSARLPAGITTGLLVAAVGALVTLLAAFLTWASVEVTSRVGSVEGGGTRSLLGVQGDRLGKATLILALATLALILVMRGPSSRAWGWIALLVAGILIISFSAIDLAAISDASDLRQRLAAVPGCSQAVQCTGNRTVGVGVYLTMLGGLAVAVGALLHHGVFDRLLQRRSATAAEPSRTPAV